MSYFKNLFIAFNQAVASLREEFNRANERSEQRIIEQLREIKTDLNVQLGLALEVAKTITGGNK